MRLALHMPRVVACSACSTNAALHVHPHSALCEAFGSTAGGASLQVQASPEFVAIKDTVVVHVDLVEHSISSRYGLRTCPPQPAQA